MVNLILSGKDERFFGLGLIITGEIICILLVLPLPDRPNVPVLNWLWQGILSFFSGGGQMALGSPLLTLAAAELLAMDGRISPSSSHGRWRP